MECYDQCALLLAPAVRFSDLDEASQTRWLSVMTKELFDSFSTDGSVFTSEFEGEWDVFYERKQASGKVNASQSDIAKSLTELSISAPQNADQFVECMKNCGNSDAEVSLTVELNTEQNVMFKLTMRPAWEPKYPVRIRSVLPPIGGGVLVMPAKNYLIDVGHGTVVLFPVERQSYLGTVTLVVELESNGVVRALTVTARSVAVPVLPPPPPLVDAIRVRVRTGTHQHAASDGDIFLDYGGRSFKLDTAANNFERGREETFQLMVPNGLDLPTLLNYEFTLRNRSYKVQGEGWQCRAMYFAYRLVGSGTWVESGPFRPGWLDDRHNAAARGKFKFRIS
jgi:hypothetical protein